MPCGEYFTEYTGRMGLIRWRIEWAALLLGLPVPLLLPFFLESIPILSRTNVIQIFIVAVAILGLNIIVGYAGELVLAQGAFMGIGAYTTVNLLEFGIGLLPAVLAGGALTSVIALVVGLPSYRVKGYYVAISTLVLQFIANWFFTNENAEWLTGGSQHTMPVEIGLIGGAFRIQSGSLEHYYLMFGILLAVLLMTVNLSRSSIGRSMRAVRDNDLAADVLGLQVFKTKLLAYFVGGFFVGLAGGLWSFHIGLVDPGHFNFLVTIEHYTILILGGLGYAWGALIGTSILLPFDSLLFEYAPVVLELIGVDIAVGGVRNAVFGALIIGVLMVEPKGVISYLAKVKEYFRKWPFSY
ncbi:branched-chain amino acid ABC transporter permease [Natronomonas marina]|jgi:branched-chain amino acid transport system permease protein|uniref:branched-chain amino acid ABC transporter permease n=1 Tax=Natronomonas marina TaxID=2961939 RepID=UPI0020C9C39E|nr:branched-chain amino acid ABC transporter permease [Natronomonas marina]